MHHNTLNTHIHSRLGAWGLARCCEGEGDAWHVCVYWPFQLVRCTVIIVTALLKAFVYGDRLSVHMWLGVGINLFAMMLVSSTTFFDKENAARKTHTIYSL